MNTAYPVEVALMLNEHERTELLSLLQESLVDTHAEKRRTEAPAYHERLERQEALIRSLIEKVRRLRP
jgi:hypothetical protein